MKTARQTRRDASELWRLCRVNGSLDEKRAADIVDGVIASGRSGGTAVLTRFLRLVKLDSARRAATVESAATLDADLRAGVEEELRRKYGRDIRPTFTVDPALIGGMRLRVGSDVYDGSIRAELAALEKSL